MKSLSENNNYLLADNFTWDINNLEYELIGNVRFEDNEIIISSEKAIFKREDNIIEFFNPVKYIVKGEDQKF